MVTTPDSPYFPSLDKCLSGEVLLISWKLVFSTISNSKVRQDGGGAALQDFLTCNEAQRLLSRPFEAFTEPSSQTRAPFDTKTSAINVTPTSDTRYDIKEIKDDALWLSKIAKLDEVSALRVVIVECQSRSTAQLLGPFSEEELVNIRGAASNTKYSSSLPVSLLSHGPEPEEIRKEFDAPNSRKQRILHTYLSEKRHLWKCSELLLESFVLGQDVPPEHQKGKGLAASTPWVDDIANQIFHNIHGSSTTKEYPQTDEEVKRMEEGFANLLLACVKSIERNAKNLETGSGWSGEESWREDVELDWTRSYLAETIHGIEYLWHFMVYAISTPSSQLVLDWCRLLQSFGFFNSFDSDDGSTLALFFALRSVASVVTVLMFSRGENRLAQLSEEENEHHISSLVGLDQPFIFNYQTLSDIHAIVLQAADIGFPIAGPAILAWSILLQTIQIIVENENNIRDHAEIEGRSDEIRYQNVLEQIQGTVDDDAVDFLARQAVNQCHVFDTISSLSNRFGNTQGSFVSSRVGGQMRECLLGLVKGTLGIGYIPEIIEATISTLTGGKGYWDIVDSDPLLVDDPVSMFLQDTDMTASLLMAAQQRYPYESLPFLQLVRALATSPSCYNGVESESILHILSNMTHFTYTLPGDFIDYETTQEEDNNNSIRLTRTINLFEPRSKLLQSSAQQINSFALVRVDEDFTIPAGTYGRIVSESGPRVAFWFHDYSALKYFGKLLETFLRASDEVDSTTGLPVDRDSVSELIGVLATILLSITRSSCSDLNWLDATALVLQNASSGLSRNRDIISVVFDIFEEELQTQSISSSSGTSQDILVSCVQFMHAVLPLAPSRVWPLMSKSVLLGVAGGSGRLQSIVEGELSPGQVPFLVSCCRLFESLIDDVSTNAARRKSGGKGIAKFDGVSDMGSGIPDQVLAKIILSFTRCFIDGLNNSSVWRHISFDERRCIANIIGKTFNKILCCSYGVDSPMITDENASADKSQTRGSKAKKKPLQDKRPLMAPLMLSASHIVDNFLSASSGIVRFQPLLLSYFDGLNTPGCTVYRKESNLWKDQVVTLLSFSKTLLRISTLLGRPSSQIEKQLFKTCPILARLYAADDSYRNPVVTLLESLVVAAAKDTSEPPSLLGYLGPQTTKYLFHTMSDLDKPLSRDQNLTRIWHFSAMIVSCRQQWVANYLLTGTTLENILRKRKSKKVSSSSVRPLLTTAFDTLIKINDTPRIETLAILEFIALAQNFWPWTVCEDPKYLKFIKSIQDYAGNLKPPQLRVASLEDQIDACYELRIAGYIAEILAMHLFHSRQMGLPVELKDLLLNLSYFERFAVATSYYNASLHGLLKRNFEMRYAGCMIGDIKRTTLQDREFGGEYFYDLTLADRMLSLDQAWTGRKPGEGMRGEFWRANVNLSLVDAQIALFHSWKYLLVELSSRTLSASELHKIFTKVVTDCLTADGQAQPPEEIFSRLSQTRADLALILTQRLVNAKSSIPEMKELLATVWNTIRALRGSFERPVPDDDILYYRSLLKILFLTVRIYAEEQTESADDQMRITIRVKQSATVTPIILDVLRYVVSNGLREIVTAIHDSPSDSSPEDLALLTGILQSCLRVSGIESCHSQIVTIMTTNETARLAMTLFSWSDNLSIDGDPIYGELSMMFLVELSSIPMMAEQLAIGGILGNLLAANIISFFRRSGVGPFAASAGYQRCYSIWVRGILPLLLNILDSVQQAIACDIALFLNQFPILLKQCEEALDAPLLNRLPDTGPKKYITLAICSEVHSVALLTYILSGFRESLKGNVNIPDVKWDSGGVLEDVEFWLASKTMLRERILPMGERETQMAKKSLASDVVTRLEEKVVLEMMGIRDVISGGDNS